jgi:hypothetical protein
MNEALTPWEFSGQGHFIILYGDDLALALSLSRSEESIFYEEEDLNPEILYLPGLFENTRVRSIVSPKTANQLIAMYENQVFSKPCTLIVDGTPSLKGKGVFVKCNEMTKAQSKMFINFHCNRLSLDKTSTYIKNLDELLNRSDSSLSVDHDDFSIWASLRIKQFRSTFPEKFIYQHLELWARENVPSIECLEMIYNTVNSEMQRYKNERK